MNRPLRIGISSCLLGDEVRFDGGHKRAAALIAALNPDVEWVRVCPEVELGMGHASRFSIVGTAKGTHMIAVTRDRYTDAMRDYARPAGRMAAANMSGYVLEASRRDARLHDGQLHDEEGRVTARARVFARRLSRRATQLPLQMNFVGRFPHARAAFLSRVRA